MLADDHLGAHREQPGDPAYLAAFERLDADPHQLLVVADEGGEPVGTLQLTFVPGLSRRGATRAQIEAVRVRSDVRGSGLGRELVLWAIEAARERGCAGASWCSSHPTTHGRRHTASTNASVSRPPMWG